MEVLGMLFLILIGFVVGRCTALPAKPETDKETEQRLTTGVLKLINSEGYRPMEYREICDTLEVFTHRERQMVFSEIILLAEEGTLVVSEEMRPKKLYARRTNLLA